MTVALTVIGAKKKKHIFISEVMQFYYFNVF